MKKITTILFLFTLALLDSLAADQRSVQQTEVLSATNAIVRPPGATTTSRIKAVNSTATPTAANILALFSFETAGTSPLESQIIIQGNVGDELATWGLWTKTALLVSSNLTVSGVIKDSGIDSPINYVLGVDSTGFFSEYKQIAAGTGVSVVHGAGTITVAQTTTLAPAFTVLTDGATITWTANALHAVQNATVTLEGNRTLAFASTAAGMTGVLIVKQDGTGSRTLTLPAGSKVIGGGAGAITLTTTASATDILTWVYDGTSYYWNKGLNYN